MPALVETAIYVLLGALTTCLLALLALPAVSRRAFRLAEARVRLAAPLSAAEARADRDALRGRHAVELALVERRADEARERSAKAEIALGRQAIALARNDEASREQDEEIARQRAELSALAAEVRGRDAEIAAREVAMRDFQSQRDAVDLRLAALAAAASEREAEAAQTRASLESRVDALAKDLALTLRRADGAMLAAQTTIASLEIRLEESQAEAGRLARQAEELGERAERADELALRVEALAAAQADTESALRAARAEPERHLRASRDADDLLRQTIARLGRDMASGLRPLSAKTVAGDVDATAP